MYHHTEFDVAGLTLLDPNQLVDDSLAEALL